MSKFAPEDLYSNLMGAEAARDILKGYQNPTWPSSSDWINSIQREVEKRLKACVPLSAEEADGVWKDPKHKKNYIDSMPYESYKPLKLDCDTCNDKLKGSS